MPGFSFTWQRPLVASCALAVLAVRLFVGCQNDCQCPCDVADTDTNYDVGDTTDTGDVDELGSGTLPHLDDDVVCGRLWPTPSPARLYGPPDDDDLIRVWESLENIGTDPITIESVELVGTPGFSVPTNWLESLPAVRPEQGDGTVFLLEYLVAPDVTPSTTLVVTTSDPLCPRVEVPLEVLPDEASPEPWSDEPPLNPHYWTTPNPARFTLTAGFEPQTVPVVISRFCGDGCEDLGVNSVDVLGDAFRIGSITHADGPQTGEPAELPTLGDVAVEVVFEPADSQAENGVLLIELDGLHQAAPWMRLGVPLLVIEE